MGNNLAVIHYCVGVDGSVNENARFDSLESAIQAAENLYEEKGCDNKISVYGFDMSAEMHTGFWEAERMNTLGFWRKSW